MLESNPLVTMITYCYNGEAFIDKYFEAVLSQTYSNIELIFFNNGSEDRTGDIIESYRERLEEKGVKLILETLKKNNPYTCELKQKAFKMMHGEYFFGCDSDDLIHPDYIEKMAGYLESHPDKGLVYCQLNVVNEDYETTGLMQAKHQERDKEAFENMILVKDSIYTAISYMMSTKWMDIVNPNREIFISRFGENYQCQMPFLYHNLQGYIDEPLGDYLVRSTSYSSTFTDEKKVVAFKGHEQTYIETFKRIPMSEKEFEHYSGMAKGRVRKDRFYVSLNLMDKALLKECYDDLIESTWCTSKEKIIYLLCRSKFLWKLLLQIKKR
jgi:glycosyltransferase involved in cell wall biosynthesis